MMPTNTDCIREKNTRSGRLPHNWASPAPMYRAAAIASAEGDVSGGRDGPDGDATLTARWTANIYEITLDANGGVTDVALVQVTFGQAVGALPTPTREGYVFLGWFDEVGSRYDASTVYSTADGVTLTARWVRRTAPSPLP